MLKWKQYGQAALSKPLHLGMLACCAVMFAPLAVFFAPSGTVSGLQDSLGVLAPILICIAAHGAMFLVMGKSCHGREKSTDKLGEPDAQVAHVESTNA